MILLNDVWPLDYEHHGCYFIVLHRSYEWRWASGSHRTGNSDHEYHDPVGPVGIYQRNGKTDRTQFRTWRKHWNYVLLHGQRKSNSYLHLHPLGFLNLLLHTFLQSSSSKWMSVPIGLVIHEMGPSWSFLPSQL